MEPPAEDDQAAAPDADNTREDASNRPAAGRQRHEHHENDGQNEGNLPEEVPEPGPLGVRRV